MSKASLRTVGSKSIWLLLAVVLLFPPRSGAECKPCDKMIGQLASDVSRQQGMALAILRQIKQFDADFRDASGRPLPNEKPRATKRLWMIQDLVEAFEDNDREIEKALKDFEKRRDKASDEQKEKIAVLERKAAKFSGYVEKFYGRVTADFGRPQAVAREHRVTSGGGTIRLSGHSTIGLGGAGYKRPGVDPEVKSTSGDFNIGANVKFIPAENTNVDAKFNYKNTVQRRKIGLTDFGLHVTQLLGPATSLRAGIDVDGYSDRDNKNNNFKDVAFFGDFKARLDQVDFDAGLRFMGRSYSKVDTADYSTTSLKTAATLRQGLGHLRFMFNYLARSNDVEALDHKDINPVFQWVTSGGGTELEVNFQQLSHPNVDDSPADVSRLKAHLYGVRETPSGSSRHGLKAAMYKYPNFEDNDFYDFGYIVESRRRGTRLGRTNLDLLYRMYDADSRFDFAQFVFSRYSSPLGSGFYSQWSLTARYYTETIEVTEFNLATLEEITYKAQPEGRAEYLMDFGWIWGGTGTVRQMKLGPVLGSTMLIGYGLASRIATKGDGGEVDTDKYLFANPGNTIKAGLRWETRLYLSPGVTWQTRLYWVYSIFYQANPTRKTKRIEFATNVDYPITPQWYLDAGINLNSSRAEYNAVADLDQYNFTVNLKYLFDVSR